MHLVYRNVNEAFKTVVRAIYEGTFPVSVEGSRNGDVLRLEEPLLLTYTRPCERVLFNSRRDANPFMHVYEALWMLAGRNDLAPVAYYAKQMGEYSDDGVTLNGAYGYRWRRAKHGTGVRGNTSYGGTIKDHRDEIDQLDLVVKHLCDNPHSRRAVIQMWNVEDDLLRIDKGGDYPCCERVRRVERAPGDATTLTGGSCPLHGTTTFRSPSRDVCCNLSVIVQCREQDTSPNTPNRKDGVPLRFLDLYVTNRSNDLIWGLLGANACLSGETVLASPEGETPLAELAERFATGEITRYPVYSFDPVTKDASLSWCDRVWKSGTRPVLELEFDDGTFLRLTDDHRLFRKRWNNRQFCEEAQAGDLQVGDRVWASQVWVTEDGRKVVKRNLAVDTRYSNMVKLARAYSELTDGPIPDGYDVHHINQDKGDDRRVNLMRMPKSQHSKHHIKLSHPMSSAAAKAKASTSRKRYFERMTLEQRQAYAEARRGRSPSQETRDRMRQSHKARWAAMSEDEKAEEINRMRAGVKEHSRSFAGRKHTDETRSKMAESMRQAWARRKHHGNHKIVAIRTLPPEDVYDFSVPGNHNAMLDNGVFVHNCHFSFLQEYLAARLGWEVGRMHTFTANAHAYQWNWKPEEWLSYYGSDQEVEYVNECCMVPLVEDAARFDDELHSFAILHGGGRGVVNREGEGERFKEPFFHDVAHPMLMAFHAHKARDYAEARCWMALVEADDWRVAGSEWIERRRAKHERQR